MVEQSRIFTKVDSTMAICDELESSLMVNAENRCRLLEALLHHALQPGDQREAPAPAQEATAA